MATVPPRADLALDNWSKNFDARVTPAPIPLGLSVAQAAEFHVVALDFTARLAIATNPATRTKGSVAAKDVARAALRAKAAQLIKIISATPTVTPTQRIDLGLNVRDAIPSPIPAPTSRPLLCLTPEGDIHLMDESDPARKGRPIGVKGAVIFTKVCPATEPPPTTLEQTTFTGIATRPHFTLSLPQGADTKKLYALARWFNQRGEMGPVSEIVVTTIAA